MQSSRASLVRPALLLLAGSALLVLLWWLPNRPQAGGLAMPTARLNSVSFSPYRVGESPLTQHFPTRAEVDQDLALIAARSRATRTYAAVEGDYDLPALARGHGLKMWQGIWLGSDRAANAREIAAGIRAANAYPDVIERVVVGNEVLLRRDLPPDELIADIDQVRRAVHQPVTYADVWNFFVANPQIVPHLDIVTIHILPYWEDHPTNIDGAIAHVGAVVAAMQARFPGKAVAIGETCWPSRGRWRQDAVPSLVNEVVFLRRFAVFAAAKHLDYNFFQAFDQPWKYRDEGVVGANWGLWTADRTPKFPLDGPVQEDARWWLPASLSVGIAWLLFGLAAAAGVEPRGRLAVAAVALGGALAFAWAGTAPVLFDRWVVIAAIGNLAGQAALALLCMHHLADPGRRPRRTAADATSAARSLLRLRLPDGWQAGWPGAAFDDLAFLFVWTAAVLQALLVYDPRYRDFPLPTFAVPIAVTALRLFFTGLPRSGGGRGEWAVGGVLAIGAVASAVREGPLNHQSLAWNACALLLATPMLLRVVRPRG